MLGLNIQTWFMLDSISQDERPLILVPARAPQFSARLIPENNSRISAQMIGASV